MSGFATNEQIDELVLHRIKTDEMTRPWRGMTIGMLLHQSGLKLAPVPNGDVSPLWLGSEHGNRSCQRLRKKGLIRYCRKGGWLPA